MLSLYMYLLLEKMAQGIFNFILNLVKLKLLSVLVLLQSSK